MDLPALILWNIKTLVLLLLLVDFSWLTDPMLRVPFQEYVVIEEPERYFRTLVVDEKRSSLYIGAAEYVYRLNLKTLHLNDGPEKSGALNADEKSLSICRQISTKNQDTNGKCRNHISVILPRNDGTVIACGTGVNPINSANTFTLNAKNLKESNNTKHVGGLKCIGFLRGNTSVVLVENRNPLDFPALYLATDKISRPALLNDDGMKMVDQIETHMDSTWLNSPDFVGSYREKHHVYFWFREFKYRLSDYASDTFSRVARICVSDKGGSQASTLKGLWTSYFKATLNCSVPGAHPYYFTELQDIVKVGDVIHAVFTTPLTGPYASAVCTFSQKEIDNVFSSGKFKDAEKHWGLYEPLSNPGKQCVNDSFTYTDSVSEPDQRRYLSSVLMYDSIQHDFKKPAHYQTEVVFRKIAVETIPGKPNVKIYYLATMQGKIHKVLTWKNDKGSTESHLLMIWEPQTETFIWDMKRHGSYLFLATESKVTRLETRRCNQYKDCFSCSRDPHCGWNIYAMGGDLCETYDVNKNLIQNVGTNDFSTCNTTQIHHKTIPMPGEMIHLPCHGRFGITGAVRWMKNGQRLAIDYSKTFLTKEDGLIISDGEERDKGFYKCQDESGLDLAVYNVTIQNSHCVQGNTNDKLLCTYISGYRRWCQEFDSYQRLMHHWQDVAANCTKCTENSSIDNAHCGAKRPAKKSR